MCLKNASLSCIRSQGGSMVDIIIIAVIVVAAVLGIRSAVMHFKGQGGCCGGGGYKPKKKKLKTSTAEEIEEIFVSAEKLNLRMYDLQ